MDIYVNEKTQTVRIQWDKNDYRYTRVCNTGVASDNHYYRLEGDPGVGEKVYSTPVNPMLVDGWYVRKEDGVYYYSENSDGTGWPGSAEDREDALAKARRYVDPAEEMHWYVPGLYAVITYIDTIEKRS